MPPPAHPPTDLKPGRVILHLLHAGCPTTSPDPTILDQTEMDRAAKFRFETDRQRWIGWRCALRRILGSYLRLPPADVAIHLGPHGKPSLAPPFESFHFNLSHAREWAALAVGIDGPLGIDLEPLDRAPTLEECAESFCHPLEIKTLGTGPASQRPRRLLELWTAKEALLKALGTGMTFPPDAFCLDGTPDAPLRAPFTAFKIFHPTPPPAHELVLAAPVTTQDIIVISPC